jgi:hypothetical protein
MLFDDMALALLKACQCGTSDHFMIDWLLICVSAKLSFETLHLLEIGLLAILLTGL